MDMVSRRFRDFPDVLDVSQVSMILQISKKTAYKLIKEKEINYIKIGRVYRVYKADLQKYIAGTL